MPYNDPSFNPGGKNYVAPAPPPPPTSNAGVNYTQSLQSVYGPGERGWYVDPSLQNAGIDQYAKYVGAGYSGGPQTQAATLGPAATANAASLDQTASNQARGYQSYLANDLQNTVAGKGPSIAGMQMQQGLQQSLAQQQAAAASMPGQGNAGMMQRNLALQAGQANQGLVGQQAIARMQEQNLAQQQLGSVAASMRASDLGAAGQNAGYQQQANMQNAEAKNSFGLAQAGYQQQANLANLGAQQQTQGLNSQNAQYYYDQAERQREADRQALIARGGQRLENESQNAAKDQYGDQKYMKMAGAVAAGAAMMSDERAKTAIEPAEKPLASFLASLGAHSYEYKDKANGPGRYVSPMAQELEKTPIGRSAVIETPRGKMVDYGRIAGTILSAGAVHERRIARLEDAIASMKGGK